LHFSRPAWLPALLTAGGAFLLQFGRQPELLIRAEFFLEDGPFYGDALARGAATVVEPYAGYLLVGHRLLTLQQLLVPPYWAPLVSNLTSLVVSSAVAAYIVFAPLPGPRIVRSLLAIAVLLIPESGGGMMGSMSHVQWQFGAWLALVSVAREPLTRLGRASESAMIAVAGLTGPFSALLAPLFLVGPRRRLMLIAATAAVQIAIYVGGAERKAPSEIDVTTLIDIIAVRGVVTPFVGHRIGMELPIGLALIVAAFMAAGLAYAFLKLPRWLTVRMLYLALVPMAVGLAAYWSRHELLSNPGVGVRYFWFGGIVMAWAILLTFPATIVSRILLSVLLAGMLLSYRQGAPARMDWGTHSTCIGGPVACSVPVAPNEQWNVVWRP
jgi:hypothetical protein